MFHKVVLQSKISKLAKHELKVKFSILCYFKIYLTRVIKNTLKYRIWLLKIIDQRSAYNGSLAKVLAFFYPKTCTIQCVVSTVLGRNCSSKVRCYFLMNVVSVDSQNSSLSLAQKNGLETA